MVRFRPFRAARSCVLVPAAVAALVAASLRAESGRLWPMPIEINLSSSFGEYRGGHLHAGVDIRTFGREGVPCRAVEAGHISRMRASPRGYGKALYLTLESGETLVYAHLAEFSPRFEDVLRAKQDLAGTYTVDLYFDVDSLRVSPSEIIGYTGRTGTSAPHLHFEIRDRHQNPMNPLSHGWELADRTRPVIDAVVWYPLDPAGRVDGVCVAAERRLNGDGRRTFTPADTVELAGTIGLSARIVDRINATSGRLAPYEVKVSVDGRRITTLRMESFTYDHTREVELAYDMGRERTEQKHFLMLYRRPGETLWNRDYEHGGVIAADSLGAGLHVVEIEAVDRAGNSSVARLPFRTGVRSVSSPAPMPGIYLFADILRVPVARLTPASRRQIAAAFPAAVRGDVLRARVRDATVDHVDLQFEGEGERRLLALKAGELTKYRDEDLGLEIEIGRNGLYGDAFAWVAAVAELPGVERTDEGLLPVGGAFEIGPAALTLRRPVELRWRSTGSDDKRRALYVHDSREGTWSFIPSSIDGDEVVASVRGPGVFAVLVDDTPPVVGTPEVAGRRSYATGKVMPEIVVPIEDAGCGLDDGLTELYLDGSKQIARWDGFSQKMFVLLRDENIMGQRNLSIIATDKVGNVSELRTQIRIPKPTSNQNEGENAQ